MFGYSDRFPKRHERPRPDLDMCRFIQDLLDPHSKMCSVVIVLDGKRYRCARFCRDGIHGGIHDANRRHTDGTLVRW